MNKIFPKVGFQIPDILLPGAAIDMQKWAVIACDQFTSEPEYWSQVESIVGQSPSTLNIILPEVYLGKNNEEALSFQVVKSMQHALDAHIFTHHQNLILVERNVNAKTRHGLILALDLEQYDYKAGSASLIRASEGTIVDRLPPRVKIRQQALIESPHILVLIDDPQKTVIEPLVAIKEQLTPLYDFDLMLGSGHLRGFNIDQPALEAQVVQAFEGLADPTVFKQKYNLASDLPVLLYAVGDGNHLLATAKLVWEKMKASVGPDHPARYALVEIENIHDQGLVFEPIHRVLFGVHQNIKADLLAHFAGSISIEPCSGQLELIRQITHSSAGEHCFGMVSGQGLDLVKINHPQMNLPVGTLQAFLDRWIKNGAAETIDYVHGTDVVFRLGQQPGNVGFILPAMAKEDLFKTVILDGVLPRKTFSMGEAIEKRFYLECRKIIL